MPSASDEQRAKMEKWFGDPISEWGPVEFLKSHGYVLTKQWNWVPPTEFHSISCYELECVYFLIAEWDFGFLEGAEGPTICLCGQGMESDHASS